MDELSEAPSDLDTDIAVGDLPRPGLTVLASPPGGPDPKQLVRRIVATPNEVVTLPAGTRIDQIQVSGADLIVHLPDGSQLTVELGAQLSNRPGSNPGLAPKLCAIGIERSPRHYRADRARHGCQAPGRHRQKSRWIKNRVTLFGTEIVSLFAEV